MVYRLGIAAATSDEAAGDEWALCNAIYFAVCATQGRLDEDAALQALCVADCRHGYVDPRSVLGVGWQVGSNHHCGNVSYEHCCGVDLHAHPIQHTGQALRRKESLPLVPSSRQSDDEAIAEELVVARALESNQFADAHRTGVEGQAD